MLKLDKIKVIKIDENNLEIEVKEIKNSINSYYEEIGCKYVDMPLLACPVSNNYMIICDDSGLIDGRPIVYYSNQIICGTLIICRVNNIGESISLDDGDIEYLKKYLNEGITFAKIIR